jgi:protein SCO1/2
MVVTESNKRRDLGRVIKPPAPSRKISFLLSRWIGLVLCILSLSAAGAAEASSFGQLAADAQNGRDAQAAGIQTHPGRKIPLNLQFTNSRGHEITLARYFRKGRPVILSFVYFRCQGVCPYVEMGLAHAIKKLSDRIGHDYDVITVSFDPTDTWQAAADKKAGYLTVFKHPAAFARHWHFLVGKESSIVPLTKAVGFHYIFYPATHTYNHAAAIYVLTPGGRISNYFFGIKYDPSQLSLALVQAGDHRISNIFDQVLLLCCSFNPNIGKYTPVALRVMSLAGVAVILGLSAMFGTLLVWEKRHRHAPAAQERKSSGNQEKDNH